MKREDREGLEDSEHQDELTPLSPDRARQEKHAGSGDLWPQNVRRRTFLAIFLMGFLQLCGIDAVLFVSRAAVREEIIS